MWTSRIAVGLTLLAILACGNDWQTVVPTYSGYEAQIQALTGHSINDAVAQLGAPTRTVDMAQGHRLYVWEEMSDAHTAVQGTKRWNPETQQEEIVLAGGERIPFDCTTEIEADGAGTVVRHRIAGVACLGQAPSSPTVAAVVAPAPSPAAAAVQAPVEAAMPPAAPGTAGTDPAVAASTDPTADDAAPEDERGRRRRDRKKRE